LEKEIRLLKIEAQNAEAFSKQWAQVVQDLERQRGWMGQKTAYLKGVREYPRVWATVLKDLRRNIPHGVWLVELETGAGGALRLAGGSMDEAIVSRFMTNLKSSSHFTHVGFTYAEKDKIGNIPIVKFEVICRVVFGER
jgi:Tfp pilus assembly protein PilN